MVLAGRCSFSLGELKYEYPQEIVPAGETPASWLRKLTDDGVPEALPATACPRRTGADRARARAHRRARVRGLLPHRRRHRRAGRARRSILCQGRGSAANSLVCYCLRRHRGRPAPRDAAVRALHQRRAQRAARHRHRLRAPAPRGGDPVHLRQVRPRTAPRSPRSSSATGRARRCATSAARSASTCSGSRRSRRASTGSTAAASPPSGCARAASIPTRRWCKLWMELTAQLISLPAPPVAAPGRLRHRQGPHGRAGAGRERGDGRPQRHPVGQGRPRRARPAQGRHPRARHAERDPPRARATSAPSAAARVRDAGHPRRRRAHLRHDLPRRHRRRVPDREPGADEHAAAPAAALLLRPRGRGRDRAARADPGRHGPSVPEEPHAARRARSIAPSELKPALAAHARACRSSRSR